MPEGVVMRSALFAFLIIAMAFPLSSGTVQEPKTKVGFEDKLNFEGSDLELAGVGLRTKMMFKVYAAGLYLDPAAKKDLSKYKGQATQALYDDIINGGFSKLFVLHFVRDVESEKIVEAFEEGLEKSIDVKTSDVQKDVQAFLNASRVEMKEGRELKVFVSGEEVFVTSFSGKSEVIKNGKLAKAVTSIWLGEKPITEELKKGLVNRL